MAISYLKLRRVTRSAGRNVICVAAYCSRSKLYDGQLGCAYDFTGYGTVVYSEIMLPEGVSKCWLDRGRLWNEVERTASRKNSQLAEELEFMFPSGLSLEAKVRLVREFITVHVVSFGVCADLNVVLANAKNGDMECFAHVLLLMRSVRGDCLQASRLTFDCWSRYPKWSEHWLSFMEKGCYDSGQLMSLDPRPSSSLARGLEAPGTVSSLGCEKDVLEIAWRNGDRIVGDPSLALECLVREKQGAFTRNELEIFVKARTAGVEQYSQALSLIEASVEFIRAGQDSSGADLYTQRDAALETGSVQTHHVTDSVSLEACGSIWASTNRTLREAADVWEAAGFRLRGVGITYEDAKRFERRAGIKSVGVKGLFERWSKKKDKLELLDILIVDGASRFTRPQKDWLLKAVRTAKARLVFAEESGFTVIDGSDIGLDPHQLAAIEGKPSNAISCGSAL